MGGIDNDGGEHEGIPQTTPGPIPSRLRILRLSAMDPVGPPRTRGQALMHLMRVLRRMDAQ